MKTNGFWRNRVAAPECALLSVILLAVVLSTCECIQFQNTMRDHAYTEQPKKILVQGVARNPEARAIFENQLVEQLEERGVGALAGHQFLPDSLVFKQELIKQVAREKGVDALFIAGPTNRKDLDSLRPGELSYAAGLYEGRVPDYDRFAAFVDGAVYSGGTYAGQKVFMEMVLYDVNSGKRIWSALSRMYIWDTPVDAIKPLVGRIVEMLSAEKIIPKQ